MRRKTSILFITVSLTGVLFVLNVAQAYRYDRTVAALEEQIRRHRELLAENTRQIGGVASLRSPSRIRDLAEDLGLEVLDAGRIERVDVIGDDGAVDAR